MRFVGEAFRAHDPRWSWSPLSGDGAALHGRRFNWAGLPTLYLSLVVETCLREVTQGFAHRLLPLVICAYDVDCEDVVDCRSEAGRAAAGIDAADLACAWANDLAAGREPASWSVVRRLLAAGAAGMLVSSYARGADARDENLILWRWGPTLPHRVSVHDPSGRLPKNALSWA